MNRVFRGGGGGDDDFKLSVLSKAHPNYPSLSDQFANKWLKASPAGGVSVERIFTVQVTQTRQRGSNQDCFVMMRRVCAFVEASV